jgi:glycosyltransferase involved in cell wall biosynthesis
VTDLVARPIEEYSEEEVQSHRPVLVPLREHAPTISVIVPTLNEARNLPYVFERMPAMVHQVIVVDGHSTDDTIDVAESCWPGVQIVLQNGRGKGNAIACGIRAATGDITVLLDADGSTDPAEIPVFIDALSDGYDFAKGTRFAAHRDSGSADITWLRRLGNHALTFVVNRIWGVQYTDLCYGYNAFWTRSATSIYAECSGFEVETLMNIRAASSGLRIVEVPSYEANRQHGVSNLNARRDGMRVLRTILAEWIRPA